MNIPPSVCADVQYRSLASQHYSLSALEMFTSDGYVSTVMNDVRQHTQKTKLATVVSSGVQSHVDDSLCQINTVCD